MELLLYSIIAYWVFSSMTCTIKTEHVEVYSRNKVEERRFMQTSEIPLLLNLLRSVQVILENTGTNKTGEFFFNCEAQKCNVRERGVFIFCSAAYL